jgi:hypothetical protein
MSAQQIFDHRDLEENDALRIINRKKEEKCEQYLSAGRDKFTANYLAWRDMFEETLEAF